MTGLRLDVVSRLHYVDGDENTLLAQYDAPLQAVPVERVSLWPPRPTSGLAFACADSEHVSVLYHNNGQHIFVLGFLPPHSPRSFCQFRQLHPSLPSPSNTPDAPPDPPGAVQIEDEVYVPRWQQWLETATVDEVDVMPAVTKLLCALSVANLLSLEEATLDGCRDALCSLRINYTDAAQRPAFALAFHLVLASVCSISPTAQQWFHDSYLFLSAIMASSHPTDAVVAYVHPFLSSSIASASSKFPSHLFPSFPKIEKNLRNLVSPRIAPPLDYSRVVHPFSHLPSM